MCKRFIEDLSNKIIEKLELNDYTTKKLRQTIEECKTILEKREQDILTELHKVYRLENYSIEKGHKNSINICKIGENFRHRKFILHCNSINNNNAHLGAYRCSGENNTINFLTKEELINHVFLTFEIKDKQTFYDMCLRKINLLQDLADNY
jgi:hypothetical protein